MVVGIMKQRANKKFTLTRVNLCMLAAIAAQSAFISQVSAQEPAVSDNPLSTEKDVERITVVGSNIKGSSMRNILPITELNAEDITTTGALDGDELLRSIPQMGAVGFTETTGGSVGTNTARGDIGSVNLRSIGEGNTLVLLNGRRMVNHPITQANFGVPVTSINSNTLPITGLSRVEVLRDGAGALYGSDAVAGVINYVTKDNFEGGRVEVRYGTEAGTDRDDLLLSGNKGLQFNDDKSFFFHQR
jgi:outer membrane receptor protein involved in Fe transport